MVRIWCFHCQGLGSIPGEGTKKKKLYDHINTKKTPTFDNVQHSFIIKSLRRLGIKDNFLNLIKNVYVKPTANIIFNVKE